jgi:DNA-binding NtrC family response regulator
MAQLLQRKILHVVTEVPNVMTRDLIGGGLKEGVKRQVLLVEDDESVGVSLAGVLELHGAQATLVTSVALGLERLREQRFDAVVSDLLLDDELGRTGFAVLAEAARVQPGIVAVLITGYPSAAVMKRAGDEGLAGVLKKPLEIGELLGVLGLLDPAKSPAG